MFLIKLSNETVLAKDLTVVGLGDANNGSPRDI
jgi:hypothetical protein